MEYKVLIKLLVPEIEKTFEIYLPVNKTVGDVCKLINKLVSEVTLGAYPVKDKAALCDRFTSEFYANDVYIRDTNIRNGSQLVFF